MWHETGTLKYQQSWAKGDGRPTPSTFLYVGFPASDKLSSINRAVLVSDEQLESGQVIVDIPSGSVLAGREEFNFVPDTSTERSLVLAMAAWTHRTNSRSEVFYAVKGDTAQLTIFEGSVTSRYTYTVGPRPAALSLEQAHDDSTPDKALFQIVINLIASFAAAAGAALITLLGVLMWRYFRVLQRSSATEIPSNPYGPDSGSDTR